MRRKRVDLHTPVPIRMRGKLVSFPPEVPLSPKVLPRPGAKAHLQDVYRRAVTLCGINCDVGVNLTRVRVVPFHVDATCARCMRSVHDRNLYSSYSLHL